MVTIRNIRLLMPGNGSYNNYLYCEEHGMEKYMKFTMYKKETTDKKYHENPYRAVNFAKDADGNPLMPKRSKIPLQENTACEI